MSGEAIVSSKGAKTQSDRVSIPESEEQNDGLLRLVMTRGGILRLPYLPIPFNYPFITC
jgi:hypothetical protein